MKKLKVEEFKAPLNKVMGANFRIIEDDGVMFPVCNMGLSTLEKQTETLLNKQRKYAYLMAAAPDLLEACKEALKYVCVEEPAYDILEKAIKKATNN